MIEAKYKELCETRSDINRHLPTIQKYVAKGDIVVELGVRSCVSTWALLKNQPRSLYSVDINLPPESNLEEVKKAASEAGTEFRFIQADSTFLDIAPIDVLFVDTLHFYSQVVKELWRHAENTRKYIIFHDSMMPEVAAAIQDFLYNSHWTLQEINKEDTGLTVVKRLSRPHV